jgi:hypothetical protein
MTKVQVVLTAKPESIKAILQYIQMFNTTGCAKEDKVHIRFITAEDLVERVSDAVNAYHALKEHKRQ